MDGREQGDCIEIDALEIYPCFGLRENGWHNHRTQNLTDEPIEHLRSGDGPAVEANGCKIQDSRKEYLRRNIIDHVDDGDAARVEPESYHIPVFRKRGTKNLPVLANGEQQRGKNNIARKRSPNRGHEAVVQES